MSNLFTESGHSEKWTTSERQTSSLPPIAIPLELIHKENLRKKDTSNLRTEDTPRRPTNLPPKPDPLSGCGYYCERMRGTMATISPESPPIFAGAHEALTIDVCIPADVYIYAHFGGRAFVPCREVVLFGRFSIKLPTVVVHNSLL